MAKVLSSILSWLGGGESWANSPVKNWVSVDSGFGFLFLAAVFIFAIAILFSKKLRSIFF